MTRPRYEINISHEEAMTLLSILEWVMNNDDVVETIAYQYERVNNDMKNYIIDKMRESLPALAEILNKATLAGTHILLGGIEERLVKETEQHLREEANES